MGHVVVRTDRECASQHRVCIIGASLANFQLLLFRLALHHSTDRERAMTSSLCQAHLLGARWWLTGRETWI